MKFVLEKEQFDLFDKYVLPLTKKYDAEKYVLIDKTNCIIQVEAKGVQEIMLCADDAIIVYGMVNQDSLTSLGCKLQLLYDELLYQKNNKNTV